MMEANDYVVGISDHDHVAPGLAPSPTFGPEIEYVMKINVREQRRNYRPLPRPLFLNRHDPVFKEYPSAVARRRRQSRLQSDRLARMVGSSLWISISSIRLSMPKSVKAISPSSEES